MFVLYNPDIFIFISSNSSVDLSGRETKATYSFILRSSLFDNLLPIIIAFSSIIPSIKKLFKLKTLYPLSSITLIMTPSECALLFKMHSLVDNRVNSTDFDFFCKIFLILK